MNNFFFSLSISETQVNAVSWANPELILYVSQAGLRVLLVLLSQSCSGGIILLWSTILCLSEHETHKLLADLSSKGVSYKFMEKKPKTKDQQQSPNRTPK